MHSLRRRYFQWCGRHVARVDQARRSVPIKPDIAERVERKAPQNDTTRSDRHAGDRVDEVDHVACFELWRCSYHMVGLSITDAAGFAPGTHKRAPAEWPALVQRTYVLCHGIARKPYAAFRDTFMAILRIQRPIQHSTQPSERCQLLVLAAELDLTPDKILTRPIDHLSTDLLAKP
jgi:hypothetical protein